MGSNSRRLYTG